jgi:hypothetical protein
LYHSAAILPALAIIVNTDSLVEQGRITVRGRQLAHPVLVCVWRHVAYLCIRSAMNLCR